MECRAMPVLMSERLRARAGGIPRSEARALLRISDALAEAGEQSEADAIRAIAEAALQASVGRSTGVRLSPVSTSPLASGLSGVDASGKPAPDGFPIDARGAWNRSKAKCEGMSRVIRVRASTPPLAGWAARPIPRGNPDRLAVAPLAWEGPSYAHWDECDPLLPSHVVMEARAAKRLRGWTMGGPRGRRLNGSRRDRRLLTPGQAPRVDTWRRVSRMNGRLQRAAGEEATARENALERAREAARLVGVELGPVATEGGAA